MLNRNRFETQQRAERAFFPLLFAFVKPTQPQTLSQGYTREERARIFVFYVSLKRKKKNPVAQSIEN